MPDQVKRLRGLLADRGVSGARDLALECALSKASTKALEKRIAASGKKHIDYLFRGRGVEAIIRWVRAIEPSSLSST